MEHRCCNTKQQEEQDELCAREPPPYILICGKEGQEPYRVRGAATLEKIQQMVTKYQTRTNDVNNIVIGTTERAMIPAPAGQVPFSVIPMIHLRLEDGQWIDILSAAYAATRQ